MKPETADYLQKARSALTGARAIVGVAVYPVAAREAYLAGFHAAEASIFERTDKTAKTHRGLRALFNSLARDDPAIPREYVDFLADGYEIKSVADYGIGDSVRVITADDAASAIDSAQRMIVLIEALLG